MTVVRVGLRAAALVATICLCRGVTEVSAQTASANLTGFDHTDRVRGVVINSVTREPISRTLVYSPDNAFATMTDDRGRFEFTSPGTARQIQTAFDGGPEARTSVQTVTLDRPSSLTVRKIGFLALDNGQDFVPINPGQTEFTIVVVPEARIIGHVVIPGWDGSQKIQVELYRRTIRDGREQWDMAGSVSTRANGEFRIAGLPASSYKLLTGEQLDRDPLTFKPGGQLMGYPPLYYPSASDFESAGLIHLAAGETFQATLSPVKKAYYPVKVGFTQSVASPQIEIRVWPQGRPGPGFSLGYNQQDGEIYRTSGFAWSRPEILPC